MDNITQQPSAVFYIKRIFGLILLLALAAVFFISGISKLLSIEAFELTFISLGITSGTVASVIAHLFIGLELVIGAFLLCHIYLKQVTYPATLVLLILLTLYLVVLLMQQGNDGNCGCFGEWVEMKPLPSIYKNLGMIAATILLMYIYPVKPYKHQEMIAALIGMAGLVVPFIVEPMNANNKPEVVHEAINMDALYAGEKKPAVELREGKHIIAFMSLTCPHCRKAAFIFQTILKNHPEIPVYFVLSGHPDQQPEFFKETKSATVPHMLFDDMDAFVAMAGEGVPAIYWVNNSVIECKANIYQLDPAEMIKWLKQ